MRIVGNESAQTVLTELGQRIRQRRISLGFTQAALAEKCGISSSTETRIESGEDSKMSNYIKILSGLNLLENIDVLILEPQPDYKALYKKVKVRQRVRARKPKPASERTWGGDK